MIIISQDDECCRDLQRRPRAFFNIELNHACTQTPVILVMHRISGAANRNRPGVAEVAGVQFISLRIKND